jgi:hypothetical protein
MVSRWKCIKLWAPNDYDLRLWVGQEVARRRMRPGMKEEFSDTTISTGV